MNSPVRTRREVLRTAALGALALPLLGTVAAAAEKKAGKSEAPVPTPYPPTAADGRENGLRLGITSYSVRNLSLDDAIAAVKSLRIVNIALFKNHCNWETASLDECRAVGAKLKAAGLTLTGSGVVNLPKDEAKCRKAFENVKAAGMRTMVCKPDLDALPLVEKLAVEFDQKLAIHNHGPEDAKFFPTPQSVLELVKDMDPRMGLCVDIGHTARTGVDVVESLALAGSRLHEVHVKDLKDFTSRDSQVPCGDGIMPFAKIFAQLKKQGYTGVCSLEYEIDGDNPLPGMQKSFAYMRGVIAGMKG